MLSVRVICVGKLGEKFWKQACDEYIKRLSGYCKPEVIELPEQKLPDTPSAGQIQNALEKEAKLIREKIPQGRQSSPCASRERLCPASSWRRPSAI